MISERVYAATEPHRHMFEVIHVAKLAAPERQAYLERVEAHRGRLVAHKLREAVNDMIDAARMTKA